MSSSAFSLTPCKTVLMEQSLVRPSSSDSCFLAFPFQSKLNLTIPSKNKIQKWRTRIFSPPLILCCSEPITTTLSSSTTATNPTAVISTSNSSNAAPPVIRKTKRKRYRKQYPGESIGISEEMRFVAMRLRNLNGKKYPASVITNSDTENSQDCSNDDDEVEEDKSKEDDGLPIDSSDNDTDGDTWKPSMEGFVKYLVDNQLVFNTVERIVDESNDVAYAYFRKTGLERSEGLAKDLEWFREQEIEIPEASTPGVSYVKYLEELAEKSAPLFLSHFYNIYFSHIAGGQVIVRQASEKILEGREMEFCRWEGDEQELLKCVREKINMLGEHWSRDEKNKCLKEAAKSFKFMGQIVRLIIL